MSCLCFAHMIEPVCGFGFPVAVIHALTYDRRWTTVVVTGWGLSSQLPHGLNMSPDEKGCKLMIGEAGHHVCVCAQPYCLNGF